MSDPQEDVQDGREYAPSQLAGPPFPPQTAGLGGAPTTIPDVPVTAVFLLLFAAFAIIHFKIFIDNKARGHKFMFSGALFGFCMIRIVTMSLRIAWACNQRDISLGLAAQSFVYAGTIILFIVNWFFTQRIIRAQHPRWGWSGSYRVLHILGLVFLLFCLLMLLITAVQRVFTLDSETLRIDRVIQLAGYTYSAAFCAAPIALVLISLAIPRTETDKFGAGRLKNNITILMVAAAVLSVGAVFRCIVAWLPPVPLQDIQGQPVSPPWYYSKVCFYVFNFTTEIFVVIAYAVTRVDLRFHIPDGSKGAGSYRAGRAVRYHTNMSTETHLRTSDGFGRSQDSIGSDIFHECDANPFEESGILVDAYQYPSSVLEVDPQTGHWKTKDISRPTPLATPRSQLSEEFLSCPDIDTYLGCETPPEPRIPLSWPLRESERTIDEVSVLEICDGQSSPELCASDGGCETGDRDSGGVDTGSAVSYAISKLEVDGRANKKHDSTQEEIQPEAYNADTSMSQPDNTSSSSVGDVFHEHDCRSSSFGADSSSQPGDRANGPGANV